MKHRKRTKKSFMQIIMTELKRFYRKTHVAITVLDREGNPIAHCGGGIDVCRYIHLKLYRACRGCDKAALIWLLNGHDRCEYLCHAGLSEAAVLVRSGDGDFDGYIIIGKYLTDETLNESKALLERLLDQLGENASAVRKAAKTLPILNADALEKTFRCLFAVAKRFEETGCLKGLRDPDVRCAIQMVENPMEEENPLKLYEKEWTRATCVALYQKAHTTRRPAEMNFSEQCGESLSKFLTQRIMIQAEDLLMNTNLSVEAISGYLGYDPCAFTTFFKRQYGDTPGHFRKHGARGDIADDADLREETVPFRDRVLKDDRRKK